MMTETGSALYTFKDLADILKTSSESIADFTNKSDFTKISSINGEKAIAGENLERFFRNYVSYHNIPCQFYEVPDDLRTLSSPWATTIAQMYRQRTAFPASVSPSQGQLLKELICNLNPKTILEIGCYIGISTLWMASGLERIRSGGIIHSVDLFNTIFPAPPQNYSYLKNPLDFAQTSIRSARLSHRIRFHKMDSNELGERYSEIIDEPIDFLYIDGDHSKHGCFNDFSLFYPYVPVGGYIMLHDIYPDCCGWDGPRYIIDNYIRNSPHFNIVEIDTTPHNFGMALIRKVGEDKNLHPGSNVLSKLIRAKAKLAKTSIWQRIRSTSLGELINKTLN